jgi:NAD(P)-dependent dehydrogenase (short-subunit alcohol dehydrogenase family)
VTEEAAVDQSTAQTALVTGAAQGVGEAIARRLFREGFRRIALVDRNRDRLEATAQRLSEGGCEALPIVADLADVNACTSCVEQAAKAFGGLDVVCNAAGCTDRGGVADTSPEVFQRLFDINVRAPFFIMQSAHRVMKARGGGVIINVSSMLAYGGPPYLVAYSASKAALSTLTRASANELKWDRVRIFAINLGWTVTPTEHLVQTRIHGLPETWAEDLAPKQPMGRLLLPEDPAGVCAFLVSEDARMMTGAVIDLDQFVAGTMEGNPGGKV